MRKWFTLLQKEINLKKEKQQHDKAKLTKIFFSWCRINCTLLVELATSLVFAVNKRCEVAVNHVSGD